MMLIRLPDDLFNRVAEISENLGKSIGDYLTELLEQTVRVHELSCSLKDAVDLYERTVKEKKTPEEVSWWKKSNSTKMDRNTETEG